MDGVARRASFSPVLMSSFFDLLWPWRCLACGGEISRGPQRTRAGETLLGLCPPCRARLITVDPRSTCRTCARQLPVGPPKELPPPCAACRSDPPPFDRLIALWRYQSPLREVVQAFKFSRLEYLGRHFATVLASSLRAAGASEPDLLVPVPLPWPRRLLRGFNQTELVASPLARALGRPALRALRRPAWAPHQTGKGRRERERTAPFRVSSAKAISGRSVLLIDDVLTTGATVRSASAALRRAGAVRIDVAVIGWTPLVAPAPGIDSP